MTSYLLIKYLHYLGIFAVVSSLFCESILIKRKLKRSEINLLARIDAVYGIGAIVTITAGLVLWFVVGKPAIYYSHNWIFISKVALFTLIGGLSIWPTIFFTKQRKGEPQEIMELPPALIHMVRIEVILLLLMPLLAVSMANGLGGF